MRKTLQIGCLALVVACGGLAFADKPALNAVSESSVPVLAVEIASQPLALPSASTTSQTESLSAGSNPGDPPIPAGVIFGRVLAAVPTGQPEPLADAEVWLFHRTNSGMVFVHGTHSGPEGLYEFRGLVPGRYMLVASAADFIPGAVSAGMRPGHEVERDILLHRAGEPEFGAVAGFVRGMTSDGVEVPLGGAVVRLGIPGGLIAEVLTDETGHFVIGDLPPGEYGIMADAEGYLPEDGHVFVEPGEVTPFDFLLHPQGEPEFGAIEGTVLGAEPNGEVPLGGALLLLFGPEGHVVGEAMTDNRGQYRIDEVYPGQYLLAVVAEGFEAQDAVVHVELGQVAIQDFVLTHGGGELGAVEGFVFGVGPQGNEIPLAGAVVRLGIPGGLVAVVFTDDAGHYFIGDLPPGEYGIMADAEGYLPEDGHVFVEPGEVAEHVFVLRPEGGPEFGAVEGLVVAMTPAGPYLPVEGATIALLIDNEPVALTVSNESGEFFIGDIIPGEYTIRATAEGYHPEEDPIFIEPNAVTHHGFLMIPVGVEHGACCVDNRCVMLPEDDCEEIGGEFLGLGSSCWPNPCGGGELGAIHGMVASGGPGPYTPIEGAHVVLFVNGGMVAETFTNELGEFALEDIEPGEYGIMAQAEGFQPEDGFVEVIAGDVTHYSFVLFPIGVENGACCADDRCVMLPEDACEEIGGEFLGLGSSCWPNPCVGGGDLGAIHGMVATGGPGPYTPIEGAHVVLFVNGGMVAEAFTNELGEFALEDIEPGEYGIIAQAEGFRPEDGLVEVLPGEVSYYGFLLFPVGVEHGACCIDDGECIMLPAERCEDVGGEFQGVGVMCGPDTCF